MWGSASSFTRSQNRRCFLKKNTFTLNLLNSQINWKKKKTSASFKEVKSFKLTQFMCLNEHIPFLELKFESSWRERLCSPALGGGRPDSAARVAAGFAVVPVAAQVDLQRQQTVGRGTILAALIWDTVSAGARFHTWVRQIEEKNIWGPNLERVCGRLPGGSVGQACRVQVCLDTGLVSGSQPRTSSLPW